SYSNIFTTTLDYNTCESLFYGNPFSGGILFINSIVDANNGGYGYDVIGLSDMLNHTITYVINQASQYPGFTEGAIFNQ
ncbi:MAG: hypothetical protein ACP5MB_11060, partial [bacterium]